MSGRPCSVPDCGRALHAKGMCKPHYTRVQRYGSPYVVKKAYRSAEQCRVDGCGRSGPLRQDLCTRHYQRLQKNGDPLALRGRTYLSGANHYLWVGDSAAYRTVHSRLEKDRGRAGDHKCVVCHESADQWSYDHADPEERFGEVTGGWVVPYSTDLAHYAPMCFGCHTRFDHTRLKVVA